MEATPHVPQDSASPQIAAQTAGAPPRENPQFSASAQNEAKPQDLRDTLQVRAGGAQNARLSAWLQAARELLWELINRRRILERLHPRKNLTGDEIDALECELADSEDEIPELCNELARTECGIPPLGILALLEEKETEKTKAAKTAEAAEEAEASETAQVLRCAVAALSLTRLSDAFHIDVETVGAVAALAAGTDPAGALAVRDAFREAGVLRQHVHLERRSLNIDHWRIGLTETGLAQVLGRECDDELLSVSYFRDCARKGV